VVGHFSFVLVSQGSNGQQ